MLLTVLRFTFDYPALTRYILNSTDEEKNTCEWGNIVVFMRVCVLSLLYFIILLLFMTADEFLRYFIFWSERRCLHHRKT